MWRRIQKVSFNFHFHLLRRTYSAVSLGTSPTEKNGGAWNFSDFKWSKDSSSWINSYLLIAVLFNLSRESSCSSDGTDTIYRLQDVANHRNFESGGIWVYYEDGVYDISKYILNHPGGNRILLAAGGDLAPYWNLYRQHFNSSVPINILQSLRIGSLHPDDIAALEKEKEKKQETEGDDDPYNNDPALSPLLTYHMATPINAEPPGSLLTADWITPSELWFARNHHPVPPLQDKNASQLQLTIDCPILPSSSTGKRISWTLEQLLSSFPSHSIISTIQCGGNRRAEMTRLNRTNGSPWETGAIATAKWTGIRMRDVLKKVGIDDDYLDQPHVRIRHVHFISHDGLEASIPLEKALSRSGDVLLAYRMNDQQLPAQHGYPLRVIVPGHVGIRNVKWLKEIRLSEEEAYGTWQRGMAYKGFGPSITSLEGIDVEKIPSLQEQPVQSAITMPSATQEVQAVRSKEGFALPLSGYSYSGGGRGIVRVDVSADDGESWHTATLTEGKQQPLDRAWAWTLWKCDLPIAESQLDSDGCLKLVCKATDASYNVQPDSVKGIWNLRGINNNAWHRVRTGPVRFPTS